MSGVEKKSTWNNKFKSIVCNTSQMQIDLLALLRKKKKKKLNSTKLLLSFETSIWLRKGPLHIWVDPVACCRKDICRDVNDSQQKSSHRGLESVAEAGLDWEVWSVLSLPESKTKLGAGNGVAEAASETRSCLPQPARGWRRIGAVNQGLTKKVYHIAEPTPVINEETKVKRGWVICFP